MKQKTLIGKKPETTHYSAANHLSFHNEGVALCGKHAPLIDSPELLVRYREAVTRESGAFSQAQRSEYTDRKAEVNRRRAGAYRGIGSLVRAQLKHFDPSVRAAAHLVANLLKSYGDVSRVSYSAGTADIGSLVDRLRGDSYLPAVETLGLRTWVNELEALNLRFKILMADTERETVARSKFNVRRTRLESDGALRRIVARIEARIVLDGPEPFAAFAREYNVLVKKYNILVHEHYGRLHARIDIAPAIIASPAPQPYTGKPVTVIPEVALRHTAPDGTVTLTELFFPDDFTVSYRNNRQPGTATLVIRGAGRYRGTVVTTFQINGEGRMENESTRLDSGVVRK
jgi:hypothetical protein